MKNNILRSLLALFFIGIIGGYFYNLHANALSCNGYVIGDWLINFQAGFVRRGLCGYLLIRLSDLLNLKPNFTVMWVQLTIYAAYMFILFLLIYRKKINIWFLILLLSPVTLRFAILDPPAVGRKEIILFLLFTLYIVWLNKKISASYFVIFLFSLALLTATLFHELVFFYTPYFILAAYLKSKIDHEPFYFSKSLLLISGSFLAMIPLYLFGKNINGSVICSGLMERGLPGNICTGIADRWTKNLGMRDVLIFAKEHGYFSTYSTCFFLGLIPFVLYISYSKPRIVTPKKFAFAFLFLLLFSSPLFLLAIDWGRWLNIHFMLLLFTSTLLLNNKSDEAKAELQDHLTIPRLWKSEKPLSMVINNIIFLLAIISYITFWSMQLCIIE